MRKKSYMFDNNLCSQTTETMDKGYMTEFYIKHITIRRCGMIANETTLLNRPNDTDITNYRSSTMSKTHNA